ncbi:hypothetical protein BD779DRAFT_1039006 [Infundibulicybe gibba]|nr:hypothetical protein BD779DRAFT_1039006 [Infundibulicybe gibba]
MYHGTRHSLHTWSLWMFVDRVVMVSRARLRLEFCSPPWRGFRVGNLILRDCFPPPPPATYAHVDLSNLKRLEVTVSLARCTCFLRQITIKCYGHRGSRPHVLQCIREGYPRVLHSLPVQSLHGLSTRCPSAQFAWKKCNFEVRAWTAQQNTEFKSPKNACIKLIFRWKHDHSRGISPLDLTWPASRPLRHLSSTRSAFRMVILLGGMLGSGASSRA